MLINNNKKLQLATIFGIALPIIVQNIVMHMQLLIDRAFLGNLNARYLAALGNVMVPYETLLFFFFAAAGGLTILIAQNIGAKRIEDAQRLAESAFFFSTLFSSGLFLIWFFGARGIFSLLGASGTILNDAVAFVRVLSFGLIFIGIDVTAVSILQGTGNTKPIMIFGIAKNVINIILDWVLIYGHLGFPAMGFSGAATATVIAGVIGTSGLFLTVLLSTKLPFPLTHTALMAPRWRDYRQTMKLGLPSGLETLLYYCGLLVLLRFMNHVDSMAIGIFSLINGIQVIGVFIYLGFASASTTLVGQAWGGRNYREAKEIGLYCLRLSMAVTLCCSAIFLLFPRFLIGIFTSDIHVIERAVPLLRLIAFFINLDVINILMGHAIRATGDTKWMLCSQIFGTLFVIGLSSVMIFGFSMGLLGMYLIMILDELIRGGVNYLRFTKGGNPFAKRTYVIEGIS